MNIISSTRLIACLLIVGLVPGCGDGVEEALSGTNTGQKIDLESPISIVSPEKSFHNSAFEVTFSCDDNKGSGCAQTWYCSSACADPVETGQSINWSDNNAGVPLSLSVSSNMTVTFRSVDNDGNLEAIKSKDYVVDMEDPVTSAEVVQGLGPYSSPIEVILSCSDLPSEGNSGCDQVIYNIKAGEDVVFSPTEAIPFASFNVGSTSTLRYHSVDKAGNIEPEQSQEYIILAVPSIMGQFPLRTPENLALILTLDHFEVTDEDSVYPNDFILTVISGANYTVVGTTIRPKTNYSGLLAVPVVVSDGVNSSDIYLANVTVIPFDQLPPTE